MTDLDLRAGQIHRGLGIVARWPDIALVIPSDSAHDAVVDEMFHELGSAPESTQLVTAVNDLMAANQIRSVGMLVEATGGPMALAFGPVEILVDGQITIDGNDGPAREQVSSNAHKLTIRASNLSKAAEPVAPYDLRRGIAPGAGLTLITVAVAEPPAPSNVAPAVPAASVPAVPAVPPMPSEAQAVRPVEDDLERPTIDPSPVAEVASEAAPPPGVRSGRFPEPSFDPQAEPAPPPEPEPIPASPAPEPPPTDLHPAVVVPSPAAVPSPPVPQPEPVEPAADERRAQPAAEPAAIAVPFRSVLLIGRNSPEEVTPLPIATAPNTGELSRGELDAGRVEVNGILCSREHFNNPGAAYCMVCGISMLHLTHNLVRGPRPTLGFIVFDDGSTFGLDRSYVIGREPVPGEDSQAELLVLHDNNETLSRSHAELRLIDWTVQLIDMNSTNGTYIWDRSFEQWNQLSPGHPVELTSGETVALGRRTFVFESVSRA